jgi:anti-anti-sigma regulatory factor
LAAPYRAPTTSGALRSRPEPGTIVLVIRAPIARADIQGLCESIRDLLEATHPDHVVCDVGALVRPDVVVVDALARLQLTARRVGCHVCLRHASGDLREILAFMGLCDVFPLCEGLPLEPGGQAEHGKEPRGVEEKADPGDLIA